MVNVPDSAGNSQPLHEAERKLALLVETALLLGRERDRDALLKKILFGARDIAHCAAATLFLKTDQQTLVFAMRTRDDPLPAHEIPLYGADGTPNERFVVTHAVLHNKTILIDDVYQEIRFDLSGTRKFNEDSGFRTVSMLTVPLSPGTGEVLGVLQLLNHLDGDSGAVLPFPPHIVRYIEASAALSALALENQRLLLAQEQAIAQLKKSEQILEQSVQARTVELNATIGKLGLTLKDLKATHAQLIQSEKMASLGQLVANVAHEINTPFSAVKSSGQSIAESSQKAVQQLPILTLMLDESLRELFSRLVGHRKEATDSVTTKELRGLVRSLTEALESAGHDHARHKASVLISLNAHEFWEDYLPLLRHPESEFILATAQSIGTITSSTDNIQMAVDRVSKIVTTLRSFTQADNVGVMTEVDLQESIETVLAIYQSQIRQNTELVCDFETIPLIHAYPQELNQVWTHLIHNALQAMDYKGKLTIGLKQVGREAVVFITDTGSGIPEAIRARIFEPFFTTRPAGEGAGLGLDIVKKIVDQHGGRIEVQTTVGVGSTFSVFLSNTAAPA